MYKDEARRLFNRAIGRSMETIERYDGDGAIKHQIKKIYWDLFDDIFEPVDPSLPDAQLSFKLQQPEIKS